MRAVARPISFHIVRAHDTPTRHGGHGHDHDHRLDQLARRLVDEPDMARQIRYLGISDMGYQRDAVRQFPEGISMAEDGYQDVQAVLTRATHVEALHLHANYHPEKCPLSGFKLPRLRELNVVFPQKPRRQRLLSDATTPMRALVLPACRQLQRLTLTCLIPFNKVGRELWTVKVLELRLLAETPHYVAGVRALMVGMPQLTSVTLEYRMGADVPSLRAPSCDAVLQPLRYRQDKLRHITVRAPAMGGGHLQLDRFPFLERVDVSLDSSAMALAGRAVSLPSGIREVTLREANPGTRAAWAARDTLAQMSRETVRWPKLAVVRSCFERKRTAWPEKEAPWVALRERFREGKVDFEYELPGPRWVGDMVSEERKRKWLAWWK